MKHDVMGHVDIELRCIACIGEVDLIYFLA